MESIGTETTSGVLLRFAEKRQTPTLSLVMGLELSSTLFTGNRGNYTIYVGTSSYRILEWEEIKIPGIIIFRLSEVRRIAES